MKKPFRNTKVFKILQNVLPAIPFGIGSVAENIIRDNSTPAGEVDEKELLPQIIKILFYIVVGILFLTGKITFEDAEAVKEIVAP